MWSYHKQAIYLHLLVFLHEILGENEYINLMPFLWPGRERVLIVMRCAHFIWRHNNLAGSELIRRRRELWWRPTIAWTKKYYTFLVSYYADILTFSGHSGSVCDSIFIPGMPLAVAGICFCSITGDFARAEPINDLFDLTVAWFTMWNLRSPISDAECLTHSQCCESWRHEQGRRRRWNSSISFSFLFSSSCVLVFVGCCLIFGCVLGKSTAYISIMPVFT